MVVLALNGAGKGQENKNRIFFSKELNPLNEPKNIVVTRTGTSANVTWDSLTLFEARGFPVYMVTLIPSSNSAVRTRRQSSDGIISINTTESSVVVEGLDENIEYNLSLAVATTAGIMEADKGTTKHKHNSKKKGICSYLCTPVHNAKLMCTSGLL